MNRDLLNPRKISLGLIIRLACERVFELKEAAYEAADLDDKTFRDWDFVLLYQVLYEAKGLVGNVTFEEIFNANSTDNSTIAEIMDQLEKTRQYMLQHPKVQFLNHPETWEN